MIQYWLTNSGNSSKLLLILGRQSLKLGHPWRFFMKRIPLKWYLLNKTLELVSNRVQSFSNLRFVNNSPIQLGNSFWINLYFNVCRLSFTQGQVGELLKFKGRLADSQPLPCLLLLLIYLPWGVFYIIYQCSFSSFWHCLERWYRMSESVSGPFERNTEGLQVAN